MHTRIAPARPPFPPAIRASLDKIMPPGVPPLTLFTTLARDERLFSKFFSGGLLDKGHLSLRQRELVILRVTALCHSEYEWSVHAALFAARVSFTEAQLYSLVHGNADDDCWDDSERLLIGMCDALQNTCTLTDTQWDQLRMHYSEEAMLELLMLAGFYRTVSYLTNAVQLPLEVFAKGFPGRTQEQGS